VTIAAAIQQVDAGVLNVGYAEDGPGDGPAILLLHGWPYDIHAYDDVASLLAAQGYRSIGRPADSRRARLAMTPVT
jgi:pimeloyl-ACP methyl ester carboxylesterase